MEMYRSSLWLTLIFIWIILVEKNEMKIDTNKTNNNSDIEK